MKKLTAVLAAAFIFAFSASALAANPFADVPAGHWAYDAVAQLAADGLVAGYPDGSYKGGKTATRYEMAALVARAVARGDELHASKQDLELIKKLVAEFKDELDAMGAKVNELDKRVGTIEKNIGAWKISGIMDFDAKFASGDLKDEGKSGWSNKGSGDSDEFSKSKARLYLRKQIDKNTYFDSEYRIGSWAASQPEAGRGDISNTSWNQFYVSTKLPYDINMKVGRMTVNWEGAAGLFKDADATFGGYLRVDGFWFEKQFGNLKADAMIARNTSIDTRNYAFSDSYSQYMYGLNLLYRSDKLMLGGVIYYEDGDGGANDNQTMATYGIYAGYTFTPGLELKGLYYWQNYDENPTSAYAEGILDDSADSWKIILDVKQSLLKFTSLWIEYHEEDNNFSGNNRSVAQYSLSSGGFWNGVMRNRPVNNNTSKYWFVKADQKWGNSKWGSFIRFTYADFDTLGVDDATEWGVGITYQYTPAIQFMLAYDSIDYGDGNTHKGAYNGSSYNGKDNVILFRTTVKF